MKLIATTKCSFQEGLGGAYDLCQWKLYIKLNYTNLVN